MQKANTNDETGWGGLLAWWQLLRIGNVFTAISNILAGALLVRNEWSPLGPLVALAVASAFLYTAGMVLNDAFDAELDARERPERPIPSGRISRQKAFCVGFGLLALGVGCSCFASWLLGTRTSVYLGGLLALAVVGYDGWWKKTEFGPSAMGICRYLNVLLGASVAADLLQEPTAWIYAAVVGMYTMGLTLFARAENEETKTKGQVMGGLVTLGSIGLLAGMPWLMSGVWDDWSITVIWYGCLGLFGLIVARSLLTALKKPGPEAFRKYVTILLLGFVVLDGLAAFAAAGWISGVIVLTLVVPSRVIARWAPMT